MKKIFAIFIFLFFLGVSFFPFLVSAYSYGIDGKIAVYQGLVPCGQEVCIGKNLNEEEVLEKAKEYQREEESQRGAFKKSCLEFEGEYQFVPCGFCHFWVLLSGGLNFVLWKIVPALIIIMVIVLALFYFFSFGSPEAPLKARTLLISLVKGALILLLAWGVLNLFFTILGLAEWTGLKEGWFKVVCELPEKEDILLCGNNKIDGEEVCDGLNLREKTCQDFGFQEPGGLKCSKDCKSFDTSQCSGSTLACGNGVLEKDLGEECDGEDFGDISTCHQINPDFIERGEICQAGNLKCNESCQFNTSECIKCDEFEKLANCYQVPANLQLAPSLLSLEFCISQKKREYEEQYSQPLYLGREFIFDDDYPVCNFTRGERICSQNCAFLEYSCHYGGESGQNGALAIEYENIGLKTVVCAWAQECKETHSLPEIYCITRQGRIFISFPNEGQCNF